jgi:hypothetical protein
MIYPKIILRRYMHTPDVREQELIAQGVTAVAPLVPSIIDNGPDCVIGG